MEAYNETTFRDISTITEEQDNNWLLNVSVYFANNTRHVINGKIEFNILDIVSTDNVTITANNHGEFVFEKLIIIPKVSIKFFLVLFLRLLQLFGVYFFIIFESHGLCILLLSSLYFSLISSQYSYGLSVCRT